MMGTMEEAWTTDMLHQMLSEHYPTLKNERWDVDVDTIRTSPILHPILKKASNWYRKIHLCVVHAADSDFWRTFDCVLFIR